MSVEKRKWMSICILKGGNIQQWNQESVRVPEKTARSQFQSTGEMKNKGWGWGYKAYLTNSYNLLLTKA